MAEPSIPPLQLTSFESMIEDNNGTGSFIIADDIELQPFISVIITFCVPIERPIEVSLVSPLVHK